MEQLSRLCRKLERVTGRRLIVLKYQKPKQYIVVELPSTTRSFRTMCNTLSECKRVLLDQFL